MNKLKKSEDVFEEREGKKWQKTFIFIIQREHTFTEEAHVYKGSLVGLCTQAFRAVKCCTGEQTFQLVVW